MRSFDMSGTGERRPSLVKTALQSPTSTSASPINTPGTSGRASPAGEWTPKSSPGGRTRSMEGFEEWTAKSLRAAELSMDGSTPATMTPKSGSRTPAEVITPKSGSGSPQIAPREDMQKSLGSLALQQSVTADILQRRELLKGRGSVAVDGV